MNTFAQGGNGGDVELTSAGGNINTGDINTASSRPGGAGGNIELTTSGTGIVDTTAGTLTTGGSPASGGNISASTNQGDIRTGALTSSSPQAGTAGNISLDSTAGNINTSAGTLDASSGTGSGGNLSLSTAQGNINTSSLLSSSGNAGTGGSISLTTGETGRIDTTSGPNSRIDASSATGRGGNITLRSNTANVTNVNASGGAGGGAIAFNSNRTDVAQGSRVQSNRGNIQFSPFSVAEIRVPGMLDTSVNFQNLALDGTSLREAVTLLVDSLEVIRLGEIEETSFNELNLDTIIGPSLTQEEVLEIAPELLFP